jgi:hypothetical protein
MAKLSRPPRIAGSHTRNPSLAEMPQSAQLWTNDAARGFINQRESGFAHGFVASSSQARYDPPGFVAG